MNLITLTKENLATEHICCAISDKKSEVGVAAKKDWINCRLNEGLKFVKLDSRGKVFIEYLPAEYAWVPVEAEGYTLINCHWVSGSYKNHGYGKALLEACENESKSKNGIVVISSKKKRPFLSDKAFFVKYGFEVCDTAAPHFELLVKRTNKNAPLPKFNSAAKEGKIADDIKGIDIFYTSQCPFTIPYINFIKPVILSSQIPIRTHQIKSKEEAQTHFAAVTTYSVFVNGKFFSNEIFTAAKLEKLVNELSST